MGPTSHEVALLKSSVSEFKFVEPGANTKPQVTAFAAPEVDAP